MTNREQCISWADSHHFYLVPMVRSKKISDIYWCERHGAGCAGKHPKYKSDTSWSLKKEDSFLLDCGLSHIMVIDIDPRNGGMNSLSELIEMGIAPKLIVRTGGGGYHYYFADWIRPSRFKPTQILPGVDLKCGQNSYVVAPWMKHPNGSFYELVKEGIPVDPPDAVIDLILSIRPHKDKNESLIDRSRMPTVWDLLDLSTFKDTADGWRGPHPVHDSASGNNFIISKDGAFWRCWRHGCSGGRQKLQRIIEGVEKCA